MCSSDLMGLRFVRATPAEVAGAALAGMGLSHAIARGVFAGEAGPVRDIVLLNAAAGLVTWELAHDAAQQERDIRERFTEKIALASEVIDSGAVSAKLEKQRILAKFFAAMDDSDLCAAIRYSDGRAFDRSDERTLGVSIVKKRGL